MKKNNFSGLNFGPSIRQPVFSQPTNRPPVIQQLPDDPLNSQMLEMKKYKEVKDNDHDSEDEITLDSIIKKKYKTKVIREFFRANLATIKSDSEKRFG